MTGANVKIAVEGVYKIFGPRAQQALPRLRAGQSKETILRETGHTVGIDNVTLNIHAGKVFVVMGLSGSGKSTLIRHFNRLIEPTAGRILIDGEDVLSLDDAALRDLRRYKMSMVFQRFALLPHKTILENVAYGLRISGTDKKQADKRAAEQIDLVGLAGFENQYPRQLSGGMQQRVGLARALATDAEILLMDEAFSALDPLIRHDMQEQLIELQKKLHKTIVFITHDLDEALRLGDHIAILKDGALSQVGTPEEILLHPADEYVARFVRDVNRGRVVTLNSVLTECKALTVGEAASDSLAERMRRESLDTVFVLGRDGRPIGAITEELIARHEGKTGDWARNPDELAPVHVADSDRVIDDVLPYLSESDIPVAVVNAEGEMLGSVDRKNAVAALAAGPVEGDAKKPAPNGRFSANAG